MNFRKRLHIFVIIKTAFALEPAIVLSMERIKDTFRCDVRSKYLTPSCFVFPLIEEFSILQGSDGLGVNISDWENNGEISGDAE